jgi:transcriptional regulator with XRE-family HTH domain
MELTLAQFVVEKREKMGLSATGLAKKSHLSLELIESVEAGIDLFLSVTARQSLARALKCSPDEIKYYERTIAIKEFSSEELKEAILDGKADLLCPVCGAALVTRVAKMYDLEDNLVFEPKGHCTQCTFQIK